MAKSDKRVHVFERNGEFFVDPPVVELSGPGSGITTFRVVNRTDQEIQLFIPAGPFGAAAINETVLPKKLSSQQSASNLAAAIGVYTYVVLMQNGKQAQGNSNPMIIIDN